MQVGRVSNREVLLDRLLKLIVLRKILSLYLC